MPVNKSKLNTLVVGSDGLIGGALMRHMRQAGHHVWGTTRRLEAVAADRPYLDLSEGQDKWQPPKPVSVAVICAGISKIDRCELEPAATARVNVEAVLSLTATLMSQGTFIVYLSTNQVFDGSRPNRQHQDRPAPLTEYGKQRAAVEQQLRAREMPSSVVRLTKVLPPEVPLLKGWLDSLRAERAIHPFADMVMAPIPLSLVVETIERIASRRLSGIIQISGERDVSYADAAYHLAALIGTRRELVQPISVAAAGIPPPAAPAHTTLDTSRLRDELGLVPPGVWRTIESAVCL